MNFGNKEFYNSDGTSKIKIGDTTFRTVADNRYFYLCTPYTNYPLGREQAYLDAAKMTMFLQENGFHVFCPIVHSHTPNKFVQNKSLDNDHDFWLTIDKKFVSVSRGLIICRMQGWDKSKGIEIEIDYAKEHNIPIYYTAFMGLPNLA